MPDGRFRCDADSACPSPLHCRLSEHLCYRDSTPTTDAGPTGDVGGDDAGHDGGGGVDAATCTDCISVTFTNAYAEYGGSQFMIDGQMQTIPTYGETLGPFDVSVGTDGVIAVTAPDGGTSSPATVVPGHSYVLALVPDATDANLSTVLVLPTPTTVPDTGHTIVRPIDALHDVDTHGMPDPSGSGQLLSRTTGMHDFDFTATTGASVLSRFNGPTMGTPLAALDYTQLPTDQAYYLFIAGRTDAHLGSDTGIRFIAALPGQAAFPSLPLAWVMNTTTTPIEICDGMRVLATVTPMSLVGAFAGVFTSHNYRAFDATAGTNCTSPVFYSFTMPQLPDTMSTGRMVVTVIGVVSAAGMWGAGGGYEGPPGTMPGGQVITYANGVPGTTLHFGTTAMPNVATLTMLTSTSYEWPSPPNNLLITYGGTARHFAYDPMAGVQTRAVIALWDFATMYGAYILDTPFGQDWSFSAELGTP